MGRSCGILVRSLQSVVFGVISITTYQITGIHKYYTKLTDENAADKSGGIRASASINNILEYCVVLKTINFLQCEYETIVKFRIGGAWGLHLWICFYSNTVRVLFDHLLM